MKTEIGVARKPVSTAEVLNHWLGSGQRHAVKSGLRGEEANYFLGRLKTFSDLISAMPQTGENENDDPVVYLHYFAGGSANFWITERDIDTDGEGQVQAFGLANMFGGPNGQDAELGYISIVEILANGGELDFHFTPCTLSQLRGA